MRASPELRKVIGLVLRETRLRFGITLTNFAEMVGDNKYNHSNLEAGRRGITIEKLRVYIKHFDMELSDFFRLVENKERRNIDHGN